MSTWKSGKKYWYRFQWKGQSILSKKGFDSLQEARLAQAERKVELSKMKMIHLDFMKLCESRLQDIKSRRDRWYLSDNEAMITRLIKEEGWALKKVIAVEDVTIFLNKIAVEISNQRANKYRTYIMALFNHEKRYRDMNPVKEVSKYPEVKAPKYVPPSKDIFKVMDLCTEEQRDYLWTLALTMARCGEINNLRVSTVNFDLGHLTISTKKSVNSETIYRNINMGKLLSKIIARRVAIAEENEYEYVFTNVKTGTNFNYRSKFLHNKCIKAGVRPFTYHCLRHFATATMAGESVPLKHIQLILGHKRLSTTQIYTESLISAPAAVTDRLEQVLGGKYRGRNKRSQEQRRVNEKP